MFFTGLVGPPWVAAVAGAGGCRGSRSGRRSRSRRGEAARKREGDAVRKGRGGLEKESKELRRTRGVAGARGGENSSSYSPDLAIRGTSR
eukprot:749263-Hanusia_phi.AAC.4